MTTELDVTMAYRLFLGREPESQEVVRGHMLGSQTISDLRCTFLNSEEFREKAALPPRSTGDHPGTKPLVWPPVHCEVDVSPGVLKALIARVEQQFEFLGKTDPHWSVVSQEQFRKSCIGDNEVEFFQSGKGVVDDLKIAASRYGIDLGHCKSCFELGCGLGRSTIWLADLFPNVSGADISAPHLELAKSTLKRFGKKNIQLMQVKTLDDFEAIPQYDVFFSIIVLQHNPPPVIAFLLETILRRLSPGGLAYFQVPTYGLGYEFVAARYLARQQDLAQPSMHIIPQSDLLRIIYNTGCHVVEMREDMAGGELMISNRLLVRKA